MVLAMFGAGGSGQEAIEVIAAENAKTHQWEKILFVDDVTKEKEVVGFPVYSFSAFQELYAPEDDVEFLISLGDPDSREKVYYKIQDAGYRFGRFISEDCFISPTAKIGNGVMISRSRVFSSVEIGDNTMVMGFNEIGHDSIIGSHSIFVCHVFVGGHSMLGNNLFVGSNSSFKDSITVGNHSVISLGTAVLKNVPENSVVIGNPGKILPRRENAPLFG